MSKTDFRPDEKAAKIQWDAILALLFTTLGAKEGCGLSKEDINNSISPCARMEASGRIADMRVEGWDIRCEKDAKGVGRYRLMAAYPSKWPNPIFQSVTVTTRIDPNGILYTETTVHQGSQCMKAADTMKSAVHNHVEKTAKEWQAKAKGVIDAIVAKTNARMAAQGAKRTQRATVAKPVPHVVPTKHPPAPKEFTWDDLRDLLEG